MSVTIQELTGDNPDALAQLAWHECVELAEKCLPLLVVGDGSKVLRGKNEVEAYLKRRKNGS
jgi:hypothetical protein